MNKINRSNNTTDFLDVDIPIPGQKYACISFISSEKEQGAQGLKIRGVYGSLNDAQNACKMLSKYDEYFDIYVCEIGKWTPLGLQNYEPKKNKTDDTLTKLLDMSQENKKLLEELEKILCTVTDDYSDDESEKPNKKDRNKNKKTSNTENIFAGIKTIVNKLKTNESSFVELINSTQKDQINLDVDDLNTIIGDYKANIDEKTKKSRTVTKQ